jgi:TPR repeat protein
VNENRAIRLYQRAAKLGNPIAQYNLALTYLERGEANRRYLPLGKAWMHKSARQGFSLARHDLAKIKNKSTQ